MLIQDKPQGRFISILSDGKFHETTTADADGAVLRKYETSDGKEGEKYERVYKEINRVKIVNVQFWDGDFGEQIQITLADADGEQVTISQNTKGNFGEDLMKKLPAIDFSKEVSIKPYSFEDENGKNKRGVSIFQTDKVQNFFYDYENGKELHGFPEYEGDPKTYKSDDWVIHFTRIRKFLVEYIKREIQPKFPLDGYEVSKEKKEGVVYPENTVRPEDVPF